MEVFGLIDFFHPKTFSGLLDQIEQIIWPHFSTPLISVENHPLS